jgi:hypothetical protein
MAVGDYLFSSVSMMNKGKSVGIEVKKRIWKRDVSPTLEIEPNQSRRYIHVENTMDSGLHLVM